MALISDGMTHFVAPEGFVYDYADPHTFVFTGEDPKEGVEHLYAKYLALGQNDSIENYIVVPDPRKKVVTND